MLLKYRMNRASKISIDRPSRALEARAALLPETQLGDGQISLVEIMGPLRGRSPMTDLGRERNSGFRATRNKSGRSTAQVRLALLYQRGHCSRPRMVAIFVPLACRGRFDEEPSRGHAHQLSSRVGPQPFQSWAPSRRPRSLQPGTHRCSGLVARSRA
jgi:hypothetical protein